MIAIRAMANTGLPSAFPKAVPFRADGFSMTCRSEIFGKLDVGYHSYLVKEIN